MSAAVASKDGDFGSSNGEARRGAPHFEFTGADNIWFEEQIALVEEARKRQQLSKYPNSPFGDPSDLPYRKTQASVIIAALQKIQKQQGFVDESEVQYLAQRLGCDVSSVEIVIRQFNKGSFNNNFYTFGLSDILHANVSGFIYKRFNSREEFYDQWKVEFARSVNYIVTNTLAMFAIIVLVNYSFGKKEVLYPWTAVATFFGVYFIFSGIIRQIFPLIFPPRYLREINPVRKGM